MLIMWLVVVVVSIVLIFTVYSMISRPPKWTEFTELAPCTLASTSNRLQSRSFQIIWNTTNITY